MTPGEVYIAFEWLNSFDQHLTILEKTPARPEGSMLNVRPRRAVKAVAENAGFAEVTFRPFSFQIDLPPSEGDDGVMATHTIRLDCGERLSMRGAINQPWCFPIATKAT